MKSFKLIVKDFYEQKRFSSHSRNEKNHGDLQTASMKALITQKVDELNDIRKKQLAEKEIQAEIEEESRKKE